MLKQKIYFINVNLIIIFLPVRPKPITKNNDIITFAHKIEKE